MTEQTRTCACGQPAPNAYLCRKCIKKLEYDLTDLARFWPETSTTLARIDKVGTGGGKAKGGHHGLPVNFTASEVRDIAQNTVVAWLRHFAGDRIPDDVRTIQQACQWLSRYLSAFVLLPESVEFADEMGYARHRVERLVDRRSEKQTAECDVCSKTLTAEVDDWTATCKDCERVVDIPMQRAQKVLLAHEQRITREQAIRAAQMVYRVAITDKTFKRWTERGELRADEDGLYSAHTLLVLVEKIVAKRRRVA